MPNDLTSQTWEEEQRRRSVSGERPTGPTLLDLIYQGAGSVAGGIGSLVEAMANAPRIDPYTAQMLEQQMPGFVSQMGQPQGPPRPQSGGPQLGFNPQPRGGPGDLGFQLPPGFNIEGGTMKGTDAQGNQYGLTIKPGEQQPQGQPTGTPQGQRMPAPQGPLPQQQPQPSPQQGAPMQPPPWSRVATGQPPDVAGQINQIMGQAMPKYNELMSDIASQDKRSRFMRILQSVLTNDPFYTDKVHAQMAGYELQRRHGMAQMQLKGVDAQYNQYKEQMAANGKLLETALQNNPNLRNNSGYLKDVARVYGMSEDRAGEWVETMKDPKTGKYSFIQDPVDRTVQAINDGAQAIKQAFPELKLNDTMSKMMAQDPEFSKKYMQDAETRLKAERNSLMMKGETKKAAAIGDQLHKLNDYKKDNGMTAMRAKLDFLKRQREEIINNPKMSNDTKLAVTSHFDEWMKEVEDQYMTGGKMSAREAKEGKEEDQLKRKKLEIEVNEKLEDLGKKRAEAQTTNEEILMKMKPELRRSPKEVLALELGQLEGVTRKMTSNIKAKQPAQKGLSKDELAYFDSYSAEVMSKLGTKAHQELGKLSHDETIRLAALMEDARAKGYYITEDEIIQIVKRDRSSR